MIVTLALLVVRLPARQAQGHGFERCLFIQQKMKIWSHTAEFKLLAFSAVTANMLELDLFKKV